MTSSVERSKTFMNGMLRQYQSARSRGNLPRRMVGDTDGSVLTTPMRSSTVDRVARLALLWACVALALAGLFPAGNADTFGHLAQGRQIAELGHVPAVDTFSFWKAEPQPWRNYEWLSDLLGYRLYEAGGANALIALKCVTLAAAGALLTALSWRLAGPRAALACALLLVFQIPASRFRYTERPHLVTLPLVALYLLAYGRLLSDTKSRARLDRDDVVLLGGLFGLHVLWVNLHGSHLLGVLLTIVYLTCAGSGGARVRLSAVLGLQLLASCISPYGPAIVIDALEHTLDPAYRVLVGEWQPWRASDPIWLLLAPVLSSALLAGVAPVLWRRGPEGRALLGTSCLLALAAFRSLRFVADYLLLSAPALAVGASALSSRLSARSLIATSASAAAVLSVGVALAAPKLPPYVGLGVGETREWVPAASGAWLASHARAPRVLGAIEDAWYVLFAAPRARVLMDGRVPFYGADHITRVSAVFTDAHALASTLEKYRIDSVVVHHTFGAQRTLLGRMWGRPGWVLAAIEDRYALFVRQDLALREGAVLTPLTLSPSYDLEWLLAADAARTRAILGELSALPKDESARGYVGWVRAMLALRPMLRPGQGNGLRAPESAEDRALLDSVQPWLARAARGAERVSLVQAYHALVAIARCDLPTAEHALEEARAEGESRESVLGAQELLLRRGQREAVAAFVRQAEALPQAQGDTWLAALRAGLARPPVCP